MKRILSLFLMVCFFMQMSVFADGSADGAAVGTAAENSVPEFAEVQTDGGETDLTQGEDLEMDEETMPISEKKAVLKADVVNPVFSEESPTADLLGSAEEVYQKDENGNFDVPSQYRDKISSIPDTMFFGVYENGRWTTEPLLDYSESDGMKPVEEMAKQGNYAAAKEELLLYRRRAAKNYPISGAASYNYDHEAVSKLLEQNIYYYESKYIGIAAANNEFQKISMDVMDTFSYMKGLSNGICTLYIIAEQKDDSLLEIHGSGTAGMEPELELMVNGEKRVFKATQSGTISAGSNRTKHLSGDTLSVRESTSSICKVTDDVLSPSKTHPLVAAKTPVPVDANTRRAVIKFDFSSLPSNLIYESATLSFYARNASGTGERNLIVFAKDLLWDESNLTWNSFEHSVINFDGEPFIRYNYWQEERFSMEYRTARHRLKYFNGLMNRYKFVTEESEKDRIAYCAVTQLCGLLDYVGNHPKMTGTDEFRNNLDIADTAGYTSTVLTFIDSEYMTAEIFTAYLKFLYRVAEHLRNNYSSGNNAGAIETEGLFKIILCLPIYKKTALWIDTIRERSYNGNLLAPDGSCIEGSQGYVATALSRYLNMEKNALSYGFGSILPQKTIDQITRGMRYRGYYSLPGFLDPGFGDGSLETSEVVTSIDYGKLLNSQELLWLADQSKGTPPVFTSHSYPVGTHEYIMRTGWGSKDMYGYTNMRSAWGSHGHRDDLEFIFMYNGRYLLTDQAYLGDSSKHEAANWVKSNEGHNTVVVNNKDQKGTVHYSKNESTEYNWNTNGAFDYFRGKSKQNTDADHTRGILFIRDKYVIINDYMEPMGNQVNSYRQLWHSRPEANMSVDDNNHAFRTNFPDTNVQVVPVNFSEYEKAELLDGWCRSPFGGGNASSAKYGSYEIKSAGNVSFETVIVPEKPNQSVEVAAETIDLPSIHDKGAVAMNIAINDKENKCNSLSATYYAMNDISQAREIAFGSYTFNGTMAYVEKGYDGLIRSVYLQDENKNQDGITLTDTESGKILFRSLSETPSVAIEISNKNVYLFSKNNVDPMENTLTYEPLDLNNMSFYVPDKMSSVYLNGEKTDFRQNGNYIYFGKEIIDAPPFEEPTEPSDTTGKDSSPKHASGGSGGGGTAISSVPKPVDPDPVNPPEQGEASSFEKELSNHWAKDDILDLIQRGIVTGDGNGLNLKKPVRRSEFIAMLVRTMNLQLPERYALSLEDTTSDDWFALYVQTAVENGISIPYENQIRPDDLITREEMCVMILRCYEMAGGASVSESDKTFSDFDNVSDWAKEGILACAELGFVNGFEDGSFKPGDYTLREQAMAVVARLLKKTENAEGALSAP